ncbi:hypothetical protein [Reyranella massiliensis]|uniref:hypothetical protein n=1 Tax=Reyranella massiliensis TaxID=445220 RepID=UPI003CCABB19
MARHGTPTAFGGYLDIVCDMAFYDAAVPVGLRWQRPAMRAGRRCCWRPSCVPARLSWGRR